MQCDGDGPRCGAWLVLLWLLFVVATGAAAEEPVTFDDDLVAILRQRCSSCHGPTTRKGDLDVTTYLNLMQGGASGKVIEPG